MPHSWVAQWTVVRTKFIDDTLAALLGTAGEGAAAAPPPRQLVNLGAGLDTRTMRLGSLKGMRNAFEVDME